MYTARIGMFAAAVLLFLASAVAEEFRPTIPRTWVDEAMTSLEVPLATPGSSPRHVSAEYYYRIPVRPIYKSYPIYASGREPKGYSEWLSQQEPEIAFDAGKLRSPRIGFVPERSFSMRLLISQLGYIQSLGATTLWVGPVFKQRANRNDFHGYAIQDFLEVDQRLGTRQDLVDLVSAAHARNMRVLLDILVNHTGNNWIYDNGQDQPAFKPWPQFYRKGQWRDRQDNLTTTINTDDDGVFPTEFWDDSNYTRAGEGSLGVATSMIPTPNFGEPTLWATETSTMISPASSTTSLAATNTGSLLPIAMASEWTP